MRTTENGSRRPSSSAETSIDEDTADQLLVEDFGVPSSPAISRAGTTAYARPQSSSFEPQRRTPSLSSQGASFQLNPRHSRQTSIATSGDRNSLPPSIVLGASPAQEFITSDFSNDSITHATSNPFIDPSERIPTPIAEKNMPIWSTDPAKEAPKRSLGRKTLFLCALVILLIVLIAVLVPVGLLVIKPKHAASGSGVNTDPSQDGLTSPDGRDPSSLGIPPAARGTVLDSTKWLDWTDFNVTYTNDTVGGLSVMVLRRQLLS